VKLLALKLPTIPFTISPRVRRILTLSGYPAFYLFCLFLFAYFTFPYERLKDRLLVELDAQRTSNPTAQHIEIDSLGPYWLSGVSVKGMRLISPRAPGPDGDRPPSKLTVDKAHVRVSILPLLIGRVTVNFGASAFGGSIDGWTRVNSEGRRIEASLDDIDVGQIEMLGDLAGGLPLSGKMNGTVEWALPEQKLSKATGTLSFTITDLTAGDGKTKVAGKLALPKLNVGAFELAADAKDGVLKIAKLGAKGQDLDLEGEGKISMRDPFLDGIADLYLKFRFSDGYKSKNEMTKSLFGAPGSTMPALFELADPRIKNSKRSDGFYGWHMGGLLKDPRFDPSPTGGGSSSAASPTAGRPGMLRPSGN
jgi:type II secretion system protein N